MRGPYFTEETYKIIRFNRDGENEVIKEGLTLGEAQEYCQDEDTRGEGWFCGYEMCSRSFASAGARAQTE